MAQLFSLSAAGEQKCFVRVARYQDKLATILR